MDRSPRFRLIRLCSVAVAVAVVAAGSLPDGVRAAPATPGFERPIDAYAAYDGQNTCDPTEKPGTADLRKILLDAYPTTGSLGIVRDCGTGGQSEHKEGRAFDWRLDATSVDDVARANDLFSWLLAKDEYGNEMAMLRRLGIMYMIFNRKIFKAYQPTAGWQDYSGPNPHTDHVHFSQSRSGGLKQTSWWTGSPEEAVPGGGYWLATTAGTVFPFSAPIEGSVSKPLVKPIVGMTALRDGSGYWLVGADGAVFNMGNAAAFGSMGGQPLNKPVVGMAATPTGKGYWLVATDGGIFSFGDATFFGSTGSIKLNKPIVGIAATPSGKGYWMVASDGGIFAYGDARFFGSTGGIKLNKPVVGMSPTPTGRGYWLVATDGGIFSYGDSVFLGSTGGIKLAKPINGMLSTATGKGYLMVASDGGVFAYGDAGFKGSGAGKNAGTFVAATLYGQPGQAPPSSTTTTSTTTKSGSSTSSTSPGG
jgi:hypothetical protein